MNEMNLTKLVELYYSNTPWHLLVENLTEHANLTMRELMNEGAHQIEDMLVDCKWAGTCTCTSGHAFSLLLGGWLGTCLLNTNVIN